MTRDFIIHVYALIGAAFTFYWCFKALKRRITNYQVARIYRGMDRILDEVTEKGGEITVELVGGTSPGRWTFTIPAGLTRSEVDTYLAEAFDEHMEDHYVPRRQVYDGPLDGRWMTDNEMSSQQFLGYKLVQDQYSDRFYYVYLAEHKGSYVDGKLDRIEDILIDSGMTGHEPTGKYTKN